MLRKCMKKRRSCFKSPRECYKRGDYSGYIAEHIVFQVPKGMLQTNGSNVVVVPEVEFQVPKGMLQTAKAPPSNASPASFKSPRECYKLLQLDCVASLSSVFQVPKGMLQTSRMQKTTYIFLIVSSPQGNATNNYCEIYSWWTCYCVSSPQGNATNRICLGSRTYSRNSPFQVPKGMLQTLIIRFRKCYNCSSFKSPRECYKQNNELRAIAFSSCFKSPRECYKLMSGIAITGKAWHSVSSPQGNATNRQSEKWHVGDDEGFKSPRECYKRVILSTLFRR